MYVLVLYQIKPERQFFFVVVFFYFCLVSPFSLSTNILGIIKLFLASCASILGTLPLTPFVPRHLFTVEPWTLTLMDAANVDSGLGVIVCSFMSWIIKWGSLGVILVDQPLLGRFRIYSVFLLISFFFFCCWLSLICRSSSFATPFRLMYISDFLFLMCLFFLIRVMTCHFLRSYLILPVVKQVFIEVISWLHITVRDHRGGLWNFLTFC